MIAQLQNLSPRLREFRRDVLLGLRRRPRSLPCKHFYDQRGSQLFDQICALDEYYPTRTELAIMRTHAREMAARVGRECILVEYGSGSSLKTRVLLEQLVKPAAYVPVDISLQHLQNSAARLAEHFPDVPVYPVCADFTRPFRLPKIEEPFNRIVVYFPGSTIGNFAPVDAVELLKGMARLTGQGGGLLIGVDLKKDRAVLERAYNDGRGITAAFNRNLLVRINRELEGDFRLDRFEHRAFYNQELGRIEMHLVSLADQTVRVGSTALRFRRGETIHTENSYKHSLSGFRALAAEAGISIEQVWTDADQLFSVQLLSH